MSKSLCNKGFYGRMQNTSLSWFSLFKKKVSAKISFLNIHKIALHLYCPLSGVLLPFPLTSRRLQRVHFSDIWHHRHWMCDCFFIFCFPLRSVHIKNAWFCVCANKCWQLTIVWLTQFLSDVYQASCGKALKTFLKAIW